MRRIRRRFLHDALSLFCLVAGLPLSAAARPAVHFEPGSFSVEGSHSGGLPSEPSIAVGPRHILSQGPGNVRIFDKTDGRLLQSWCANVFFGTSDSCCSGANPYFGDGGGTIDPVCFYDPVGRRFLALLFSMSCGNQPATCHVHLAVSSDSDPTHAWFVYHMDESRRPGDSFHYGVDRPLLGVSADKVVVRTAMIDPCTYLRSFERFRVIDRDSLYAHLYGDTTVNYRDLELPLSDGCNHSVGRNASADDTVYLTSIGGEGDASVSFRKIVGKAAAATLTSAVSVPLSNRLIPAVPALQRDSAQAAGFSRLAAQVGAGISELWVRNGILTQAWHQGWSFRGHGMVDVIHLLRFRATDRKVLVDQVYGRDSVFYAYPAVCDDSVGNVYLGFDGSSRNSYPSCYVTAKLSGEASLEVPPALVHRGLVPFHLGRGGGDANPLSGAAWGDYTGCQLDATPAPGAPLSAYYVGQWSKPWVGGKNVCGGEAKTDTLATWIQSFHVVVPNRRRPVRAR